MGDYAPPTERRAKIRQPGLVLTGDTLDAHMADPRALAHVLDGFVNA